MFYIIILETISFVECFLLFIMAKSIFSVKPDRQIIFYLALLADSAFIIWEDYSSIPKVFLIMASILWELFLLTVVCMGSVKETLLLVFGYNIGTMLVDLMVYMIARNWISFDENSLYDWNLSNSILSIISKSICSILVFFFIRKYRFSRGQKYLHISMIVYVIPVISVWMLCILLDYSLKVKLDSYQYVLFYITMVGILLLNIFLIYFCEAIEQSQQRKIKIEMLQQEKQYYEELKKSYEQVKKVKHDFDKQLSIMAVLLEQEEYVQLKDFFKSQQQETRMSLLEQYTGNTVLDAIIDRKKLVAEEKQISFFVEAEKVAGDVVNPFHICIMLENVLDNAIEAVERLIEDGVGYGYIRLKICNSDKVNGKNLLISVSNSCREESTDFSTTKTDKEMHGYGISNIENAVEKMGGICTMGIESREFRFVAKIPIIDNKKLQENGKKLQVEQNHQTLY